MKALLLHYIIFFHVFIMYLSSLTPGILFLAKEVSKGGLMYLHFLSWVLQSHFITLVLGFVFFFYLFIFFNFLCYIFELAHSRNFFFPRIRSKQGGVNASAFSLLGVTIPLYYPSTWICLFLPV